MAHPWCLLRPWRAGVVVLINIHLVGEKAATRTGKKRKTGLLRIGVVVVVVVRRARGHRIVVSVLHGILTCV